MKASTKMKKKKKAVAVDPLEGMHFEVRYAEVAKKNEQTIDQLVSALKAKAANGNYVAFQYLYALAVESSTALQQLATKSFPAIRPFARRKCCWPVLCSPGNAVLEEFKAFIDQIELGADWPIDLHRFARMDTVSRQWVFKLIRRIDVVRLQQQCLRSLESRGALKAESNELCTRIGNLPDLSKSTVAEWFELAWEILKSNCGGHPENIAELRQIGMHGKAIDLNGQAKETAIKDNIKASLHQALENLIKK